MSLRWLLPPHFCFIMYYSAKMLLINNIKAIKPILMINSQKWRLIFQGISVRISLEIKKGGFHYGTV